jgi:hypothetical protein
MGLITNVAIPNGGVAQTLGAAAGRTYAINNYSPVMFGCTHVVLVTTATAGNRNLVCRLMDASNNILFEMASPNIVASLTTRVNYGAGMTAAVAGNFIAIAAPDMPLPPLAQLNIFDAASIDVNDTVLASVTTAYLS